MAYDIVTAAGEILDNLGKPNEQTELSLATTQRVIREALVKFNKRVGKWTFRDFNHTANTQIYDMAAIFPTISWQSMIHVFNGDLIIDKVVGNATVKQLVLDETTSDTLLPGTLIPTGSDISVLNSIRLSQKIAQYSFEFIEPSTVVLLPPPDKDCVISCIVKEKYDWLDLPEDYFLLVRGYAQSLCQEIVGNARGRLNSVARTSEIQRYTNREKYMFDRSDLLEQKFDEECGFIVTSRMKMIAMR